MAIGRELSKHKLAKKINEAYKRWQKKNSLEHNKCEKRLTVVLYKDETLHTLL